MIVLAALASLVEANGDDSLPLVEYAQSIYDFDLSYQQRALVAADEYIAAFDADAILRWRPLHVDPIAILVRDYMHEDAMPERLLITPFEDLKFEAVRIDYQILGHIESANWKGRLVGAHTGRVDVAIVGGESNPSFLLKIVLGPDDQPMVYSIVPTLESDVYVAIEGNPHKSWQIDKHE